MIIIPSYIPLAIREGTIAGCLQMVFQLILYQLGYEYYAGPFFILGVLISYVFISIRLHRLWKLGKVKRLLNLNFGFIYIAIAFGAFINMWFRYALLHTLDPQLNTYIIQNTVRMTEIMLKASKFPEKDMPAELLRAAQEADLTNIPSLLGSYIEELIICLGISGILAYFMRSKKDLAESEEQEIERRLNESDNNDKPSDNNSQPPIFTPILK